MDNEKEEVAIQLLRERMEMLDRRIESNENRIHELRETHIASILEWQNRAIGYIVALTSGLNILVDWLKNHLSK